jgi:hypothetical protein
MRRDWQNRLTASRVLGTEVGSTTPAFLAFLAFHVLAGVTAVISGAIVARVSKLISR